jgi:P4 family phage/plasmid primase-like protien
LDANEDLEREIQRAEQRKEEKRARQEEKAARDEGDLLQRDDDAELSRVIADRLDQPHAPTVYCRREFYTYSPDTGTWAQRSEASIKRMVLEYAGAKVFAGIDDKGRRTSRVLKMSEGRVRGSIALAGVRLFVEDDFFDKPTPGLACKNGYVVVTAEGQIEVRDHSPNHRARYCVPFPYQEDTPCDRWLKFLDEIFLGDADAAQKIAAMQEFFGLCLTSRAVEYEAGFILYGPQGANGKSVLVATIEALFPRDVRRSIPPQKWDHEYYKAGMDGAMLNCVGELPNREILDSESFKDMMSGDSIVGRHPSGRPFTFRPKAGHIFAANRLPATSDLSPAFFRRWRLIELNRSFKGDPQQEQKDVLKAKLAAEVPGITCWALLGAARMATRSDYTRIPSSEARIDVWKVESDPIALFVQDLCEALPDDEKHAWATGAALYAEYRRWCEKTGRKGIHNETTFGQRLTTLGYPALRRNTGVIRPLRISAGVNDPPPYDDDSAFPEEPVDEQGDLGF